MSSASAEPFVSYPTASALLLLARLKKDAWLHSLQVALLKDLVLNRDARMNQLVHILQDQTLDTSIDVFVNKLKRLWEVEVFCLFDALFAQVSLEMGKELSKLERESLHWQHNKSLVYGEVEYKSFVQILHGLALPKHGVGLKFYDLGSGTGRAVLLARLHFPFQTCVGIEILSSLHQTSLTIQEQYEKNIQPRFHPRRSRTRRRVEKSTLHPRQEMEHEYSVRFVHGSMLECDWSDGDVVFANSTCFSQELMTDLSFQAERLKPGSFVITFTKALNSVASFTMLHKQRYKMSWGPATVFVHQRRSFEDEAAVRNKVKVAKHQSNTIFD